MPPITTQGAEGADDAGTEWFWRIVDANGLGNVPSDEGEALRLLCLKASRYDEGQSASSGTPGVRSLLHTARSGLATYGDGAFEGTIAQIDAILAFDPATPAPAATPGVPDSVRALSEAFAETACCASCTTPMDCYQGKPCRLEPVGSGSGVVDHEFKSHPDVFWPAARGEKTFEYRRDDRGGYEVGQTVRLRCYDLTRGYHDTAPLDRRVTNILRGGEFELPMGYCILSLAPLASSTPAPAGAPGVPDSVRALMDQEPELTTFAINPEGGADIWVDGTNRFCREDNALEYREWARSLKSAVRTLISTHPAGQSTGQGAEAGRANLFEMLWRDAEDEAQRLEAGMKPSRDQIAEAFHEHRRERQSNLPPWSEVDQNSGAAKYAHTFVDRLLSIRPEEPATVTSETLVEALAEFQRRNGYHKREIEELLTEFGELLLSKVKPAPDSTRTGDEGAKRLREAVSKALHDNQFLDGWPEMVDPVVEAVLAARPEAPSDAGWSQAARDVLAERRRQVEAESWTPEHDDGHSKGELACAAACYAAGLDLWTGYEQADRKGRPTLIGAHRVWPWSQEWWKPADRRRRLVKSGALILAEIERIDRSAPPSDPAPSGQAEG